MDSSLPLDAFGGRVNTEQGQIFTTQDADRIGAFSVTSLLNFLSLLFWDDVNAQGITGFPRERLTTDACVVSSTSALGFEISTGWGMFWNSASTPDDFEPHRYRPIVVDAVYAGTLATHDATNPRIDLVCLAPAWEEDVGESRNVKNPGTGVITSDSISARRKFSASVQVVTGTPAATPSAPAVPSGYVEIGRATVPASTGAAAWEDTRPILEMGHLFKGLPRFACDNYVPLGGAEELEVSATSPASLSVVVERGRSSINGVVRFHASETLALTAAHATLDRIDLVTAVQDATLAVIAGTPHASPTAPALPSGSIALAEVLVEATVTSVSNAEITDLRDREPFDGTMRLQKNSTNHDRLVTAEVLPLLTVSDSTGQQQAVDIELFYPDGVTEYDGEFGGSGAMFEAELFYAVARSSSSAGDLATDFSSTPTSQQLVPQDPDAVGGEFFLWFKPPGEDADAYNYGSGPAEGGKLLFWMPGRTGKLKVYQKTATAAVVVLVVRPHLRPGAITTAVLSFS